MSTTELDPDLSAIPEQKLEGWKEIATYLGKGVRTVQRWEGKGLPIRRLEATGAVYAYASELDQWREAGLEPLVAHDEAPPAPAMPSTPSVAHPLRPSGWAAAAAGVLILIALLIMRVPTRLGLEAETGVAVLDFRNLSGSQADRWLSTAVPEMLRNGLAVSGKLRLVSGEDVARMRRELDLPAVDTFSKATLGRIWKDLKADYVVHGSYLVSRTEAETQVRLQVSAQDAHTGALVATDAETGREAALFDLVDRANRLLRAKLSLRDLSGPEVLDLKASLPRNLESERLYSEGLSQLRELNAVDASELLSRAVEIEPTYALAHAALARAWADQGYQRKARQEAALAYRLSGPLAPEDALAIEGQYHELAGQWNEAIHVYQQLSGFAPQRLDYALRLAAAQIHRGSAAIARRTLARIRESFGNDPQIALTDALAAEAIGDFKAELAEASAAEQQARARAAQGLLAQALLRQCWALYRMGRASAASAKANEARIIFASVHDPGGEAQALKNLADVVDDQGDHAQAVAFYQTALALFRQVGHQQGVAVTLNNMAYAFKDQGDLVGAQRLFDESLRVSREIDDNAREALAWNGIGIVLWRRQELRAARVAFEEALKIHRERNDQADIATILNNIALILEDQGDLAGATTGLDESLRLLRRLGDRNGVARELGNLGDVLALEAHLSEAEDRYREQVAMGESIPEDKQVAYGLHGLGNVLLLKGDLKGARANLQQALALRERMGEAGLAAETRLAIAHLAWEEGNFPEALLAARAAAQEFEKEGESDLAAAAYGALAHASLLESRLPDAVEVLRQSRQFLAHSAKMEVQLQLALEQARIDAARGKRTEAITSLRFVSEKASRLSYTALALRANMGLAGLAFESGQPAAAGKLEALEREAESKGLGLMVRDIDLLLRQRGRDIPSW